MSNMRKSSISCLLISLLFSSNIFSAPKEAEAKVAAQPVQAQAPLVQQFVQSQPDSNELLKAGFKGLADSIYSSAITVRKSKEELAGKVGNVVELGQDLLTIGKNATAIAESNQPIPGLPQHHSRELSKVNSASTIQSVESSSRFKYCVAIIFGGFVCYEIYQKQKLSRFQDLAYKLQPGEVNGDDSLVVKLNKFLFASRSFNRNYISLPSDRILTDLQQGIADGSIILIDRSKTPVQEVTLNNGNTNDKDGNRLKTPGWKKLYEAINSEIRWIKSILDSDLSNLKDAFVKGIADRNIKVYTEKQKSSSESKSSTESESKAKADSSSESAVSSSSAMSSSTVLSMSSSAASTSDATVRSHFKRSTSKQFASFEDLIYLDEETLNGLLNTFASSEVTLIEDNKVWASKALPILGHVYDYLNFNPWINAAKLELFKLIVYAYIHDKKLLEVVYPKAHDIAGESKPAQKGTQVVIAFEQAIKAWEPIQKLCEGWQKTAWSSGSDIDRSLVIELWSFLNNLVQVLKINWDANNKYIGQFAAISDAISKEILENYSITMAVVAQKLWTRNKDFIGFYRATKANGLI